VFIKLDSEVSATPLAFPAHSYSLRDIHSVNIEESYETWPVSGLRFHVVPPSYERWNCLFNFVLSHSNIKAKVFFREDSVFRIVKSFRWQLFIDQVCNCTAQ
jgi:hypothetical protein